MSRGKGTSWDFNVPKQRRSCMICGERLLGTSPVCEVCELSLAEEWEEECLSALSDTISAQR